MFPRYLRGIIRLFKIPKTSVERFLSFLLGVEIERIQHGDSVPNYSDIRIGSYSEMVDICEWLTPEIENDEWKVILNQLLQEESATVAVIKFYCRFHLHVYYFPLVL